ncbi:hypothetical protein ACVXG7_22830 [Enterobacter hormaechei]
MQPKRSTKSRKRAFRQQPAAISGLGSSAGFDMELQDHAGAGHDALMAARDKLLELAGKIRSLPAFVITVWMTALSYRWILTSVKRRRWASPSTTLTTPCKRHGLKLRK